MEVQNVQTDVLWEELDQLCESQLQEYDRSKIKKAFYFCVDAHSKTVRASGEPYFTHPVAVAKIVLQEYPLDSEMVAAALLHDVVEDTEYTLRDIEEEFGKDVAMLVDGVTKISGTFETRQLNLSASYRKLLISLANDPRVILIKLADRLHNMRTLEFLPREKQYRLAKETLEIYAPLAHRFGLASIKWELEDLAFKTLNRSAYDELRNQLQMKRNEREKYIQQFVKPIEERLRKEGFQFQIHSRVKHLYSIYNKMIVRGKSLDEIHDLFAVRIIIDSENPNDCYVVYGIIADIYTPVPERFKDYISVPKKNGYQSLHTTVIGPNGQKVEIQIRTRKMHEIAEKGIAAHYRYKEELVKKYIPDQELEEWVTWIREILEQPSDEVAQQLIESFRLNLYQDEIYVFTPKGDLKILPKGATPVDFAYYIHSSVGHHCIGAKVNGKIVPLNTKLKSGDQVEIITSKNQTPNEDWLQFVVTHRAKSQIRKYLNEEKRRVERHGEELWRKRLKKAKLHINNDALEHLVHQLKYHNRQEFFYAIGSGAISDEEALQMIQEVRMRKGKGRKNVPTEAPEQLLETVRNFTDGVYIVGSENTPILYSYARCCHPIPGDEIVGVITVGRGIKVHRKSCKNVFAMRKQSEQRLIPLQWSPNPQGNFVVGVFIAGRDRPGVLNEVTQAILSVDRTNIRSVNIDSYGTHFEGVITVYVRNLEHFQILVDRLRSIKDVLQVYRYEFV